MAASVLEYQPMTTITLYGPLRQFGREFRLVVNSTQEAIKALCIQIPGFERFLADAHLKGMEFAVFRGDRNIGEDELHLPGAGGIRIAPVIGGRKRGGIIQTIVGVALIVAATIATGGVGTAFAAGGVWGTAAAVGASMVIGGVIQMLSPQVTGLNTSAAPENQPSYAFGAARNTTASGNPVPLCIGERRWGGAIISAGIYAEDQM